MPRRPTLTCAGCSKPIWKGSDSLPQGQATCRSCRSLVHGSQRRYKSGCRCDVCTEANRAHARRWNADYKAKHGVVYRGRFDKPALPYDDKMRARDAVRRARLAGAKVETFAPREVFERDGWVCGICTDPVDRELSYPDPGSASLDHVLPLVAGGEHSLANTQLAHLRCNLRKGARVPEEVGGCL